MKKNYEQVLKEMEERKKEIEFISTGFSYFDRLLDGGFLQKELVVLGGLSGSGKSYVAAELFFKAVSQGFKSAYFSLEISSQMVVSRLIGSRSGIKPIRIMTETQSGEEWSQFTTGQATVDVYSEFMNFYDDVYELDEIYNEIKKNAYEYVVIDFIQNVVAKGQEYERMSYIALELQKMAKELNCCILVLSQVSNESGKTIEKESGVLEYKGSGSIATVCDLGMMIVRERTEEGYMLDSFKITVRKNRRGRSGEFISFDFIQPGGRIEERII